MSNHPSPEIETQFDQIIDSLSDEQVVACLQQFFESADQEDSQLKLEHDLLKELGLLKDGVLHKSKLIELMRDVDLAHQVLNSLANTGDYPPVLLEEIKTVALEELEKAKHRVLTIKRIWRYLRVSTKSIAVITAFEDATSLFSLITWLGFVYGMWGILDRATADPQERIIARGTAFSVILEELHKSGGNQPAIAPERIIQRLFDESDEKLVDIARQWQQNIQALIDAGVSPIAILNNLQPNRLHNPFHWSVATGEQAEMSQIEEKLGKIETNKDDDAAWNSVGAHEKRRQARMELMAELLRNHI